jgi:hypothetical protein
LDFIIDLIKIQMAEVAQGEAPQEIKQEEKQ